MKKKVMDYLLNLLLLVCLGHVVLSAEVIIQVPFEVSTSSSGSYRLDYYPPEGTPAANYTFQPAVIANGIIVTNARPGTKYSFKLYYSNSTVLDQLTWTAIIATTPDQPIDIKADVESGQIVNVRWKPPLIGKVEGYKLKVIPKFESDNSIRNIHMESTASPFTLRDLVPGGKYELNLFSIYDDKESLSFISTNFTTKPNTPGRFIVWFRNETTLLVLWQPPYPSGIFTQYRVSINPPDALQSIILVDKEGEPPGPAQAAFHGLVPGRAYNISVQTVSGIMSSTPTVAQYRTIPLPPENVTFDTQTVESDKFTVNWLPPKSLTEFDRYQVSLGIRRVSPQAVSKDVTREATFDFGLLPGRTYKVIVKTMSGNVQSWPATGNVTTRPLSVAELKGKNVSPDSLQLSWAPDNRSHQEYYKLTYREMDLFNGDSSIFIVKETEFVLEHLLPGRNYSISVIAVSQAVESKPTTIYKATTPSSPVIELIEPMERKLNISWKSDVTSRQDSFEVAFTRNDTGLIQKKTIYKNSVILDKLYPGAVYNLQVYAVSHGVKSEPIVHYQAVYPSRPESLTIVSITNSSMIITWTPPKDSLYSHYVVKHRLTDQPDWIKLDVMNVTSYVIPNLISGERYAVQVKTVSHKVESFRSQQVEQTVEPSRITEVKHILDSYNVTFQWIVPQGRIDYYLIVYNVVNNPANQTTRHITSNKTSGETMSVIVGELKPGELYSFRFYTISHGVRSNEVSIKTRTMPVIDSYVNIVINQQERDTLGIKYTPTPTKLVMFDRYRFKISDPAVPVQEKLFNDTNRLILFNNLTPGKLYNISIWTVSQAVHSFPISRQVRLYPEPVKKINAVSITDVEVTLAWNMPPGDKDGYEVQYLNDDIEELISNFSETETIKFSNLRPHRNYTFTITVISGKDTSTQSYSLPYSETFQTLESIPGKVQQFEVANIRPSDITLRWRLPDAEQNGILTGYLVTYEVIGSNVMKQQRFPPHRYKGTINKLLPGQRYLFKIVANTKIGQGNAVYLNTTMPIWPPPQPSERVYPEEISHTTSTIRIRYRKNYFSNIYGPIIAYTIIVAEDKSKDNGQLKLPSWQDVQDTSSWPPYQVVPPYYPFNGSQMEEFLIGSEECDESSTKYCNGPLKSGTQYRLKIRAFTARDKYSDTVYSEPIETDPNNTPIIVGVIVPIILLIIITFAVLIIRRKRFGSTMKSNDHRRKDDSLSIRGNEIETSRPIKLKDFAEHYRIMSADSDFRFSEEFEDLKHIGREQACNAADLPVNRPKNRFTNILPYDHSRVKLLPTDDEEGSDYINANYMSGFVSPREFIVTQGSLHCTRDDFWRMVWEQNSRAIVMLTRCIEKGREKCDHYWPYDTQPVYYGDIQVTILNESQYQDWTITEFKVMRGSNSRVVLHFHFTTWPDFGVPEPPQKLVKFVRAFRDRVGYDQKPIITHCSAGVGRSGTFIVLDRLIQHILKYDYVDIYGMVYEMRKDRVWMVQTEQQYICIHQCLLCVLDKREGDSPHPEVHDNQGFEDDEGIAESGI